ncbi:MAG: TIGR01459 family HAD-type hydrolase [Hyphomicrobiaceae bacterium]|nr:TIGR01459 family HAD-type hydrolase [Hyphomicrobiaceae bacterium]
MTPPPILTSARALLDRYDVVFCDIWGVVHDGRTAYSEGCDALTKFRESGGTVILVSNAPRTAGVVADILAEKHVPENCWDAIVPSGDLALAHAAREGIGRVHHIGPDRDLDLFDGAGLDRVTIDAAEALLCTGLVHDRQETAEDYRPRLEQALEHGLPFICANPDLIVDVGGDLLPCAGSIAAVYEAMGGDVYWAGKPHRAAYEAATALSEKLRDATIARDRILAIGDAVRTDIAGARDFGIDAMFIGQGIHREDVMPAGDLDEAALARLFAGDAPRAVAAMSGLAW